MIGGALHLKRHSALCDSMEAMLRQQGVKPKEDVSKLLLQLTGLFTTCLSNIETQEEFDDLTGTVDRIQDHQEFINFIKNTKSLITQIGKTFDKSANKADEGGDMLLKNSMTTSKVGKSKTKTIIGGSDFN